MVAASRNNVVSLDKAADQRSKGSSASLSAPKANDFLSPDKKTEDTSRLRSIINTQLDTERSSSRQQSPRTVRRERAPLSGRTAAEERAIQERNNRLAARQAGEVSQTRPQSQTTPRPNAQPTTPTGLTNKERDKPGALSPKAKDPLAAPITGFESGTSQERSVEGLGTKSTEQPSAQSTGLNSGAQSATALSRGPGAEVVKLLDLVGPEATLTLKERLKEVWVNLDNTATTDLDVIARMPANELGLSNAELLTVQSPQGVHFVAFLRNRNDFEVLQTFDRHALLPGNPSKQLMEAAVMAYEQLGVIFKEGAANLERKVGSLPDRSAREREVMNGVRGQWVSAKRRRKKCEELIKQLLNGIEQVESLEEEEETQPGTPSEQSDHTVAEEKVIKAEFERPVLKNDEGE